MAEQWARRPAWRPTIIFLTICTYMAFCNSTPKMKMDEVPAEYLAILWNLPSKIYCCVRANLAPMARAFSQS